MLILIITFPAGRYHATQWGRNVNEGDPEWPPSPYRLAKALIDVQKRRYPEWQEKRIEAIIDAISINPDYLLPDTVTSHIKSYMCSNEKSISAKQLIFDSFVAVDRHDQLVMAFQSTPSDDTIKDLVLLLEQMNFLGRSESWVRIQLGDKIPPSGWNCTPAKMTRDEHGYNLRRLACALSQEEYQKLPISLETSWLDALSLSTNELLKEG